MLHYIGNQTWEYHSNLSGKIKLNLADLDTLHHEINKICIDEVGEEHENSKNNETENMKNQKEIEISSDK